MAGRQARDQAQGSARWRIVKASAACTHVWLRGMWTSYLIPYGSAAEPRHPRRRTMESVRPPCEDYAEPTATRLGSKAATPSATVLTPACAPRPPRLYEAVLIRRSCPPRTSSKLPGTRQASGILQKAAAAAAPIGRRCTRRKAMARSTIWRWVPNHRKSSSHRLPTRPRRDSSTRPHCAGHARKRGFAAGHE